MAIPSSTSYSKRICDTLACSSKLCADLLLQSIAWISGAQVTPLPAYRALILRRPFLRMLIRSTPSTCSAYRLSRFPSACIHT